MRRVLRRLEPRRDDGAGLAEYAGLVVLAALILGALVAIGVPSKVETGVSSAICRIFQGQDCGKPEASGQEPGGQKPGDQRTGGQNNGGQNNGNQNGSQDQGGQNGDEPDLGDLQDQADQAQKNANGIGDGSNIKQQIIDLLKDFIGITDVEDCITKGSISACLWAALDVGSLFFAALKIAKFAKAVKAAVKLFKDFNRLRKAAERAKTALKAAKDRLRLAREACGLPGNSFAGSTPVLMASGRYRPIRDIRVGDRVLAAVPGTAQTRAEPVRGLIRTRHREAFVRLEVAAVPFGLGASTRTVTPGRPYGPNASALLVTPGHRVWSRTRNAWVEAAALRTGEWLAAPGGPGPWVSGRTAGTATRTYYNLSVAGPHTYFVSAGRASVLVHNAKRCNLPSYKKVKINMDHIRERHVKGGKVAKQRNKPDQLFPENMTENQIQKTIKEAYRNGKRVGSQPPDQVKVRGEYNGVKVEMYINVKTKEIETAYPIK